MSSSPPDPRCQPPILIHVSNPSETVLIVLTIFFFLLDFVEDHLRLSSSSSDVRKSQSSLHSSKQSSLFQNSDPRPDLPHDTDRLPQTQSRLLPFQRRIFWIVSQA
jgi:hypothetical protein